MKMFKKIISIMMVASMVVSFAACTQNAEEKVMIDDIKAVDALFDVIDLNIVKYK